MDITFDPPLSVLLDHPWSLCATEHTQGTKDGPQTTVVLLEADTNGQCTSRLLEAFALKTSKSRQPYVNKCRKITGLDATVIDTALQQLYGQLASHLKRRQPKAPPASAPAIDPAAALGTVSPCTHVANARRLVAHYQPTLRYVVGVGWILWTGEFWRPDPTSDAALATGFVADLAQVIAAEAAALYAEAARTTDKAARKALYTLAIERGHWAAQSEQATTISAGLKLAKHALLLDHERINPDPWLLNCQNGTLDLRTGTLKPHDPADLITHLAPVTYDPMATCPTWERFLKEVFAGDHEMVAFMQRAIGWCLTGVVQERALFLLYGSQGHNGKTTLVELVRDLLGTAGEEGFGYARKVEATTFMKSKNHEDNLRKAAQLAGARFVYSSEIDEDHRLNEQLIKDMTGGDTMEARRLYKEAFNFKPTFKPWMYGNHKPEIRGTDDAIWSRVKLVEFPVSFANRTDDELPTKLRKELSGVLNWALTGCLAWQQKRLNPPPKVLATTEAYRKEQDTIGQFLTECCLTGEDYMQCKASALYAAYRKWVEANDMPLLSQRRFGGYLTTHGYPSDENATGRGAMRQRIALRSDPRGDDTQETTDTDEDPHAWDPPDSSHTATLRATHRSQRVATNIASNGATKPGLREQDATLATLDSRRTPREEPTKPFPGTKGSKGSNSTLPESELIKKQPLSAATLSNAKGSTFDGESRCPQCGCSHLLELGAYRKCALCSHRWQVVMPPTVQQSGRPCAVGEYVLLLSADGVYQNATPYQIMAIVQGPDGQAYAQFTETNSGWLLAQCERVPASAVREPGDEDPGEEGGVADDDASVVPF
jgi:P4 family phage/plasmid primase-like protien